MTPNPILKVLSTLAKHQVQYLLMGGQACVLYGAAEFSRDTDIAILAESGNLARLATALAELEATTIAVPPFDMDYLLRGHAVHFRCHHLDAHRVRLDVMACMRNVDPFPELWGRRRTVELADGLRVELMSVADLVQAKKTQRDKDWPMIRRLVETHFLAFEREPTPGRIEFWLRETRSCSLLLKLANLYPEALAEAVAKRPLLALVHTGREAELDKALAEEETRERDADRAYWSPLKKELEQLRHRRDNPREASNEDAQRQM